MTLEEAIGWLKGERSSINYAHGETTGEAQVNAARIDAASTEQAYWLVRAFNERLLSE